MQSFLYIEITTVTTYRKPVPEQVKRQLLEVAVLDIDAQSDELLLHYALRLLHESDKVVVCMKADANEPGLGKVMALLEELFHEKTGRLILLLGDHPRLLRMFQARPQVQFKQIGEEDVLDEVKRFLGED